MHYRGRPVAHSGGSTAGVHVGPHVEVWFEVSLIPNVR
jgi:hypothetical protein